MLRIRIVKPCEQESNRRDRLSELDECYLEHEEYEANEEEELRTKLSFLESTNAHGNTFIFELLKTLNITRL